MLMNAIEEQLAQFAAEHLTRKRFTIQDRDEASVIIDQQQLVNFCSNDYLGLATHPKIKKAFIAGVEKYGIGSGAASLVSGFYQPHQLFEEKFAAWMGDEQAILFNSGYHANLGVMTVLGAHHEAIISDRLCHASLLDGIQLTRKKHHRYHHKNTQQAETFLRQYSSPCLLVTEGVFSMEGDIAPLATLATLAKQYQATLILDDAHGVGVLGAHGRGAREQAQLSTMNMPCQITPLGKSFGSMGAVVSGKKNIIEGLMQFARTYRYSTALPPALVCASIAALTILQQETWRREKLQTLIHYFVEQAKIRELPLVSDELTPIKAILIGNNQKTLSIQKKLLTHGFFVSCIRAPTVPKGTARIRISLTCLQTENDIARLLDLLTDLYKVK